MSLPTTSTIVGYPDGDTSSTGTVLHVEQLPDGRFGVVLDRTAFHAVDLAWPDQGADRGTLAGIPVVDAVVGATDGSTLYLGHDVPVRKGTEGWAFLVVHLLETPVAEGDTVEVIVDAGYRRALSLGHTACHLASLALNASLAGAWTKPVATDAAGRPNFDALAIDSSTIVEGGSVDVYRVGRSLRKKGFAPALLDDLAAVQADANAHLAALVSTGAAVTIERDGDLLDDRRYWICGEFRIPCGGTHARSTTELAGASIALASTDVDGALQLVMTTSAN